MSEFRLPKREFTGKTKPRKEVLFSYFGSIKNQTIEERKDIKAKREGTKKYKGLEKVEDMEMMIDLKKMYNH